jgi:tetratricopeptide (TPR) repeat protein
MRVEVLLVGLGASLVVGGRAPARGADLADLPAEVRDQARPLQIDWRSILAAAVQSAYPLRETRPTVGPTPPSTPPSGVPSSSLAAGKVDLLIASARQGRLQAEDLASLMREGQWTAEDVAAFWDRLDRETADRARRPDVAGQVLAAIEQVPHLRDAYGDDASVEALFGLAQVKLYARELPEARDVLNGLLVRLDAGEVPGGNVSQGLVAYRLGESYAIEQDWEKAREWFLTSEKWGAPVRPAAYDVRSEALVEAARICRRLAEDGKAIELYRTALTRPGWGRTVAALDLSALLAVAGNYGEAASMLQRLLELPLPTQDRAILLSRLGVVEYGSGDSEKARAALEECLRTSGLLADPGARLAARPATGPARALLTWLDRWAQSPLYVPVKRLALRADRGRPGGTVRFTVAARQPMPLEVTPSLAWVVVRQLGQAHVRQEAVWTEFEVGLAENAPLGQSTGSLAITSAAAPGSSTSVRIEAVVLGELEVLPRALFFGFIELGEQKEVSLTVRSRSGKGFSLREARASDEAKALSVAQPVQRSVGEWAIPVTILAKDPGQMHSTVLLMSDVPGEEHIEVPVYADVRVPE